MAEYVYLVWASQTDWYKIGVTTCPQSRLESLQTGTPTELVFVSIMETSNAVVIEQFLLEKWQQRSADARGEWVKFHPWDLPEVFSDFRVSMDSPVVIPPKRVRPTPQRENKGSTKSISEQVRHMFPAAPYSIHDADAKTIIESAINAGLSKTKSLDLFGVKKGGNLAYIEFSALWDEVKELLIAA